MPLERFYEWMILEQLEPFGERADYLRAGIIASTIANCNRSSDHPAFKPDDFMPDFDGRKNREQTDDEIFTMLDHLTIQQDAILRAHGKQPGSYLIKDLENPDYPIADVEDVEAG